MHLQIIIIIIIFFTKSQQERNLSHLKSNLRKESQIFTIHTCRYVATCKIEVWTFCHGHLKNS